MATIRASFIISGALLCMVLVPAIALAAWSEPSQAPTGGNPDAPINTGTQNQNKNGGLTVTGFAVFGNTSLNGNTYLKTGVTGSVYRYLNFGADYDVNGIVIASTIGSSGYGIRDKDGTLEFKNSGGSWQSIQAILWELCGGPCGGGPTLDTPVSFHVHKNGTDQTVTGGTYTLLTWNAETFDTNNNFDLSTERFTPTVAGKYILSATAYCSTSGSWCGVVIRKNGTDVARTWNNLSSTAGLSANTTAIVDANGSTDYFDVTVYAGSSGSHTISGASHSTYFMGSLLSPQSGGGGPGYWTASGNDISNTNSGNVIVDLQTADGDLEVTGENPSIRVGDTVGWYAQLTSNSDGIVNMIGSNSSAGNNYGYVGTRSNHPLNLYTNNVARITITNDGKVGIGTANPAYKLDVAGAVNASGGYSQTSDARLKKNIRTSPGLDVISRLRGVLFDWKESGTPSAGVIAQEVEKVMPEAVSTGTDGTKSVNYNALVGPLIEAVKEQQKEIQDLKTRLKN